MAQFVVHCANDKIWNLSELIMYLQQNQGGDVYLDFNPEAPDLTALGLYALLDQFEFRHVTIVTNNPFEQHDRYFVSNQSFRYFLSKYYEIDPALQVWNHNKVFMALYGRPTAARLGLAAHLSSRHESASHVHLAYGINSDELHMYELDKLLTYDANSIEPAGQLLRRMPLHLASPDNYVNTGYNYDKESVLTNYYADILVDVVGETFVQGKTFLPTEKTTRPMLLKKPFVVFASANYLDYLHQLGFRTFCEFWDETYDGYQGRERYLRILKLLDHIAGISRKDLIDMYQGMQSVLQHNWELLRSQTYSHKVTLIS